MIKPFIFLLLAHAAAFFIWCWFTTWEAEQNAKAIQKNGAKNSLGFWWHVGRTAFRGAVVLALVSAPLLLPLSLGEGARWASAGLLVLLIAYFTSYFAPALNPLRSKPQYYVSYSQTTALTDKLLWRAAWRKVRPGQPVVNLPDDEVQKEAGLLLKKWLQRIWAGGFLVYVLTVVAVLLIK